MGGYISQLGEQHTLPGPVSKDKARGRIDEWDDTSVGHEKTHFKSEHGAWTWGDCCLLICTTKYQM